MKRKDVPSKAQAKFLARRWGSIYEDCPVVMVRAAKPDERPYVDPTIAACLKREWVVLIGDEMEFANGAKGRRLEVSPGGLLALETFLMNVRVDALASGERAGGKND